MKNTDIDFLIDLQHELLTQPNDGNADPVWWGVMEDKDIFGFNEDYATNVFLIDEQDCDFEIKNPTIEDIRSIGVNEFDIEEDDFDYVFDEEQALSTLNVWANDRYKLVGVQTFPHIDHGCLFLTKKECKEYIDRYGYNHKNPHTYAMTAYRCETYGRLLDIIKNTDWKELENVHTQ